MSGAGGIANTVAIVMGSQSDWPTMKHAADALQIAARKASAPHSIA